ncbi:MAG: 50S ribosomal protein L18 [Acidobacteriia bacterium]|jgi:large subunit ribosomal protein L18|nr:50S ribosomal protein L18 [Terriglobia bacterium]
MAHESKAIIRKRVHKRIRRKVAGSTERPRLAVFRSVKHIYAQVIDDAVGHTLAAASSNEKNGIKSGGNVAGAKAVGKLLAERAKEKGVKSVVFDRGGYQYHGRVKALADAAREGGLEF